MKIFLSTSPARGTTESILDGEKQINKFLSTSPARGTTYPKIYAAYRKGISIHVPREGDDLQGVESYIH